jgi:hypothetical protein
MQLSDRYAAGKLFHISADKYFLVVRISLEEARSLARRLKEAVQVDYRISPRYAAPGRPVLRESMRDITGVTTHLGVASYSLQKLEELLGRYPIDIARNMTRTLIVAGIEEILNQGKSKGGNCIISWDKGSDGSWSYVPL